MAGSEGVAPWRTTTSSAPLSTRRAGAFLAVPVATLIADADRYGRDQLDGPAPDAGPDGPTQQSSGDPSRAQGGLGAVGH